MIEFYGVFILVTMLSIGLDWALLSRHVATYIATNKGEDFPDPPSYFSWRVGFLVLSAWLVTVFINHDPNDGAGKLEDYAIWPAIFIFLVTHFMGILRIRSVYK